MTVNRQKAAPLRKPTIHPSELETAYSLQLNGYHVICCPGSDLGSYKEEIRVASRLVGPLPYQLAAAPEVRIKLAAHKNVG